MMAMTAMMVMVPPHMMMPMPAGMAVPTHFRRHRTGRMLRGRRCDRAGQSERLGVFRRACDDHQSRDSEKAEKFLHLESSLVS
jgi:hypothetical protein